METQYSRRSPGRGRAPDANGGRTKGSDIMNPADALSITEEVRKTIRVLIVDDFDLGLSREGSCRDVHADPAPAQARDYARYLLRRDRRTWLDALRLAEYDDRGARR